MTTPADANHVNVLSDSLKRLQVQQNLITNDLDVVSDTVTITHTLPASPREGYGFRRSGLSTPIVASQKVDAASLQLSQLSSLVPDPNGLGWPGESFGPHGIVCQPLHFRSQVDGLPAQFNG